MNIPANIRSRRLALGLTQTQAASRCDPPMATPNWSELERGTREPRISTLERIAGALDCTVPCLLV